MRFIQSIHRLWRATEGSVLLESAIVTPVLLALFLGVYEFSWYFNRQQLVVAGIRDAARYLAAASSNPCSDTTIETKAKNLAVTGTTDGTGAARVNGWTAGNV